MSSFSNTTDEYTHLECTCKKIRDLCDDLVTEALRRFDLCPVLTLPNIAIDFHKCDESVDAYLEVFHKGPCIVWKDIGKCAPQELEKTMNLVTEAEKRLNEEINKDMANGISMMAPNDTENGKDSRPMSQDSDTSRITNAFQFIQKIASIFKFNGKGLHVGRMVKNCPVTLVKGQLTVITLDERYHYCSTKEIMFVSNLRHFQKKLPPGTIIQIGDDVILKILKQIDKHLTCCVQVGGVLKSYTEVFIEGCYPVLLPCLSDTDKQNCQIALKHKVTAVILPHPHTVCYVNQIRKFFCEQDDKCRIKILVEFDEDVFLCEEDSCKRGMTLQSVEASDGIYLPKPLLTVVPEDVMPLIQNKIIVSNYLANLPSECYYGINSLLPTCCVLTRHRHDTFTSQFASFTSMLNSVHRSVTDDGCQCRSEEAENAKVFMSITSTGDIAIELSCARKALPIIAITDDEMTTKELHLFKGVKPIYYDWKQQLKDRSDKSTLKYLLRLSVAYARHLCLLYEKFCIKQYQLITKNEKMDSSSESLCNVCRSMN